MDKDSLIPVNRNLTLGHNSDIFTLQGVQGSILKPLKQIGYFLRVINLSLVIHIRYSVMEEPLMLQGMHLKLPLHIY